MVKTEHAEMLVKGKDMIYAVGFDKGKAGAVGVAQAGEVVFAEDSARGFSVSSVTLSILMPLRSFLSMKEREARRPARTLMRVYVSARIKLEVNIRAFTSRIQFKRKQGSVMPRISWHGKRAKGSSIHKNLHSGSSPYRYLSWFIERSVSLHSVAISIIASSGQAPGAMSTMVSKEP